MNIKHTFLSKRKVSGVSPAAGHGATSLINNRKFKIDFSYEVSGIGGVY